MRRLGLLAFLTAGATMGVGTVFSPLLVLSRLLVC